MPRRSVSVSDTPADSTVEISVELTAPAIDGSYKGNFELRNADGTVVPLGIDNTFWVKIVVGTTVAQAGTTNCNYTTNPEYVAQLIELINKARADVGRAALTVNPLLITAAQAHSLDMACNDFLEHSGSDGTWIGDRLVRAGYTSTYYLEVIAMACMPTILYYWSIFLMEYIRVLRLLEKHALPDLRAAAEKALAVGALTRDAIAQFLFPREEWRLALFSLDGHPHLLTVHIAPPNLQAYRDLLGGGR